VSRREYAVDYYSGANFRCVAGGPINAGRSRGCETRPRGERSWRPRARGRPMVHRGERSSMRRAHRLGDPRTTWLAISSPLLEWERVEGEGPYSARSRARFKVLILSERVLRMDRAEGGRQINQTVLIAPVEASSAGPTKSNASHPRSGSTRLTWTIICIWFGKEGALCRVPRTAKSTSSALWPSRAT
jgi:hypothetical protein